MRCKWIAVALGVALAALGACAAPHGARVCAPVSSWASPAYRCVAPPAAPAPEPVVEAEPEPAPPPPEEPVAIGESTIELQEKIEFETNSAELTERSRTLLDQVAQVMKDHPEIRKIRIDGHTDSTATPAYNQRLSTQRAAAVATYLREHGVAAGRLSSQGFGQTKPIADNDTEAGRAANRRVEIRILERAP